MSLADMFEIWFQLLTDTRGVHVDRFRLDVMAHIDGIETQSVSCWFHGHVVKLNKGKVRV